MIPETNPVFMAIFFMDMFVAFGGISFASIVLGVFLKDRKFVYGGLLGVYIFVGMHLNMTHIYHHLTGTLP